jgi:poly(3-hydroxybutyrate) depolymerase
MTVSTLLPSTRNSAVVGLAAFVALSLISASALAQPGQGRGAGRGGFGLDPRAQDRTYRFVDTNEDLPYCVFVSSKVSKDKPAPLIISLHGLGAGPQIMCNTTAVDLAEAGGYILAAPMGYNTSGWYGSPVIGGGARGRGRGAAAPDAGRGATAPAPQGPGRGATAPAPQGQARAGGDGPAGQGGRGAARGAGGGNQPENLPELSEKDVMNVLDLIRKEFNVDPTRIYLTGHSMGGAGTYFLGSKHAGIWAAIAPVAPAAFSMQPRAEEYLKPLKDAGVAIMVVHGADDEVVPVATSRDGWVPAIKKLGIEHEYVEMPGVTHGPVITQSQQAIYEFFGKHSK